MIKIDCDDDVRSEAREFGLERVVVKFGDAGDPFRPADLTSRNWRPSHSVTVQNGVKQGLNHGSAVMLNEPRPPAVWSRCA